MHGQAELTSSQVEVITELARRFGAPTSIENPTRTKGVYVTFGPSPRHRDGMTWRILANGVAGEFS